MVDTQSAFSQRPQGLKVKSFKVGLGGNGIYELEKFITSLGRDLSLVDSISASSINATTSELTLLYRDHPEVPSVQASNPPNGFIASSGTPVVQAYFQYSSPIGEASLQTGSIYVDSSQVTGEWFIESGTNNYVMSVRTSPYYSEPLPALGLHSVRLNKSILSTRGLQQSNTTFVGYTHAEKAGATEGQESLYSRDDLRGIVKIRYALIDSTASTNKKVRELLKVGDELIAFTSVQKTADSAELYMLVAPRREPKVVTTYPRYGANNPDEHEFEHLTLIFKDDIDVDYLTTTDGAFAVNDSWSNTRDIPKEYITVIDSKTIQVAVNQFMSVAGITNNYVNVVLKVGLRSSSGLDLTKGYTFGYSTNLFLAGGGGAVGPAGPQGPIGPTGASGLAGTAGPPGADGVDGAQGPPGDAGESGVPGVSGARGISGSRGDTGPQGPAGEAGSARSYTYVNGSGNVEMSALPSATRTKFHQPLHGDGFSVAQNGRITAWNSGDYILTHKWGMRKINATLQSAGEAYLWVDPKGTGTEVPESGSLAAATLRNEDHKTTAEATIIVNLHSGATFSQRWLITDGSSVELPEYLPTINARTL